MALDTCETLSDPVFVDQVELYLPRDHQFSKKSDKAKKTCGVCDEHRLHPNHGAFSYREFGSGSNHWVYQKTNDSWQDYLIAALQCTDLPPVASIMVEGIMCFPDRRDRDQGNFRFPVEKFLGDALQHGGWLKNDKWSCYQFGQLDYTYIKDESWIRLLLSPTALPSS